jgi:hypothetical protein
MRIALCLSGQPRGLPLCLDLLKQGLDVDNMDIFFHAWYDPSQNGQPYSSAQAVQNGKVGVVHPQTKELLLNTLKPKDYIIEPQREFPFTNEFISYPEANQNQMASIFYSIYMANLLKRKYERLNGFLYDLVIRTRYDLVYDQPITPLDYIQYIDNNIVTAAKFQTIRNNPNFIHGWYTLTDKFAFSTSRNMDIFCSTYPHMRYINKQIKVPYGENYLGYRVRVMGKLNIHCAPFEYDLMHRKMDINNAK